MTTIRHMCLNIDGALNSKRKVTYLEDDNGRPLSNSEGRAYLKKLQFEGKRVMPVGDCDNFDYQTGCKGHQSTEE